MWLKTNITSLKDLEYFEKYDEWLDLDYCITKYNSGYEDPLEHLPKFESRKDSLTRRFGDLWNLSRFDHSWYGDLPYYKVINRVLTNNIGKSYDLTYSYICKLIPERLHWKFEQYFIPRYYFYKEWKILNTYFIDYNGLIQLNSDRYIRSASTNWKKIWPKNYYEKRSMKRKSDRLRKYLVSIINWSKFINKLEKEKQIKNEKI